MALSEQERRLLEQIEHGLATDDAPPILTPPTHGRRWRLGLPAAWSTGLVVAIAVVAGFALAIVAVPLPSGAGVPIAVAGYLIVVAGCRRALLPVTGLARQVRLRRPRRRTG